ncbi:response regulator transcription factor [Pseudonocardia sp. TRM90224]|uniref:response regulator transcription factor n=1 Tax=Pseudonocardia sp. TRM90224 TaxID=2812678 RepID=UPI001E62BB7B|nr:response regulator [Pseudonocardia sp. TRM90224]
MPAEVGETVVHIVDDDDDLRQSLRYLLASVGIQALDYPDAPTFLAEFDPAEPAVVIVDVRMPGMSGFQLQEELERRGYPAPMIFCSAHGDIPMSVRAMAGGAVDFLEKPYDPQRILEVVQHQQAQARQRFVADSERRAVEHRIAGLTQREREVLRLVIEGKASQAVARKLGTSVKTIDVHRARIKAKTGVDSLAVLVRDVLTYGVEV